LESSGIFRIFKRMNTQDAHIPAGRIRRLLAGIIDIVPVYLACFLFLYLFTDYDFAWKHRSDPVFRAEYLWRDTVMRACAFLLYILYCALSEASPWQASLGKKLMRLKVVRNNGQPLSLKRAFMRNINKILSCAVLGLGLLWILLDRKRLAWHDILTDTMVVNIANTQTSGTHA